MPEVLETTMVSARDFSNPNARRAGKQSAETRTSRLRVSVEPNGDESGGEDDGTSYDCGTRDNRRFFGILHLDRAPLTKPGTRSTVFALGG